jgi:hypothetical protein
MWRKKFAPARRWRAGSCRAASNRRRPISRSPDSRRWRGAGRFCRSWYPKPRLNRWSARSLALQTQEGWFEEYGGPDLGYLSVTVDCLWDLFDVTGDERFLTAIDRAVACIKLFTAATPAGSIGMHNSRNTDYLVPYGLVRAALQRPTTESVELVGRLFGSAGDPAHFFQRG